MKVLTFTSLFPNHLSPDHAVFIKNRMAAFAKHEPADVKVVAPVPFFPPVRLNARWYAFSQIRRFETLDGLEIWHPRYLVTPKVGMAFYGINMFLGALQTVKTLYRSFPFDIIDAHYIYPDGLAAVLMGKYFRKPVVLSARGTDVNFYPRFGSIRKIMKYTLSRCTSVISVCASLKDIMTEELGVSGDKIHVIPNGINTAMFRRTDTAEARLKLGIPNHKKVLISVGALIERKGHHLLVDGIGRIRKDGPVNFSTFIVGEGEYRKRIEDKITENGLAEDVRLVGQIPNHELVSWYNAADIFFLGSSREGWPNVVSEALACGTPVIATRANGVPEIITSDDYGILVDRTPESFATGIRQALSRAWDHEKIYGYGQSRTWKTVASEVYDVFDQVIHNASADTAGN
ncbi:glycosyl transferase family 1 [Desulfonema ishimotonii]|uniref:Glycosyl transferase family 1 n=1 Tax=Desulfonema ishimotonii TaxID=45657 RepID=A0A401FQJ5_9BACT|nr:glycosyltransferase family 4 protein [Desulfonema ishimotonii]GBC59251.1 glycosyl transferase family 1 [Desulfonema ishimotonii]